MPVRPIQLKTGDTIQWRFTLKDETGAAVSLTSASVTLNMRLRGATTDKIQSGVCAITDASGGIVTFSPTATHTSTEGVYDLELKVIDSNARVQHTFENIEVVIRPAYT
jgi:hypothetical protein